MQATTTVLSQAESSVGERMRRGWVPDVAVAEALLSHAADMHADFIVMGGYPFERLRVGEQHPFVQIDRLLHSRQYEAGLQT